MNSAGRSNASALDVETANVDRQQTYGDGVFPYVLRCQSADATLDQVTEWVAASRDRLLELATEHGAVLFRDLPTRSAEDFDAFIRELKLENFPYERSLSNAVRVNRTERVFSANEAPPEVRIFFHHEMAQTPLFPKYILFFCEIAPEAGGATPLCRSDVLLEKLAQRCPEFVEACETKGLCYTNVMPAADDPQSGMGRSWRSTLGVESAQEAEARLRELGYTWQWLEGESLKATTPTLPAVMEVRPGKKTFFNQLIAAFCGWKDSRNDPSEAIRHGDGSRLDADAVRVAGQLADELTFDHLWQPGDIVLLDNTIAMHARRPFQGTRKVLASLAEMHTHAMA